MENKQLSTKLSEYFIEETSTGFYLCKNHNNQIIKSREIDKQFVNLVNEYKYKDISSELKAEVANASSRIMSDAINDIKHGIKEIEFNEYLDKKTEEIKRERERKINEIWKNKNW